MNLNFIKPIAAFIIIITTSMTFEFVDDNIVEEPEVVAKVVDPKQLACMAKNIFYEAGSESLNGQAAVARVVMNRIAHGFGKNPCAVIYQVSVMLLVMSGGNQGILSHVLLHQKIPHLHDCMAEFYS